MANWDCSLQGLLFETFTVPTLTLKVLFVFIVVEHRRREVLHFNVTDHPTAAWTSQQIVEAFAEHDTPRYLLRDRDGVYGSAVRSHFIILNARHLKRTVASYFSYYHGSRTHLGLDKLCPFPRQISGARRIVQISQLGGLHHRYERIAA
jgi:putative transposase